MVSLYNLMREYEDRRQALVDQLQNNKGMDPAMQHQIYGAIKEIENFLKTIEFHMAASMEPSIELARDRPRPLVEKTRLVVGRVRSGTRRVVREHIPRATKKIVHGPKNYLEKRRERQRLRKEVERELLERLKTAEHPVIPEPLPAIEETTLEEVVQPELPKKPARKRPAKKQQKRKKKKR